NVVGLREAQIGDRVGYGGAFTCQRPTRLALLPLGYGDGLSRESWRGAEVLVRGRRAPIVGEISMNQTVVDVTDLPQVVFGEEVVLIGAMGDQQIWAEERVPAGGCAYEVTSLLQSRLPRVFGLAGDSVEGRDAERGIRRDAEALRGRADRPSASSGSSNG
ncbi:MAG: alanine racemase, partial [Planctomycetota bacterium]